MRVFVAIVVASVTVAGCAGMRLPPPPEAPQADLATIRGMDEDLEIRFWGDQAPPRAADELALIRKQIAHRVEQEAEVPNDGRFDVLALSGGGGDGAYGAGVLNGWSDRGDRPEFGLVTGISVGALIAPFAFLGPDYDDELERLFTLTSTADVIELNVFRAIFGWALGVTDVRPLELTFDRILTPALIDRIGEEHRKGRRLWIGTTYLDAQRPVIWDIGAIAASNYREKRELIQKILLASAAIPGAFPPVMFPVEIDGSLYAEMHVDGSVTRQVFAYPPNLGLGDEIRAGIAGMRPGTIYLVRNAKLAPDFQVVDPSVVRIVERSLFTLTNALALGDVSAIEQQALSDEWTLLRTAVPLEFDFAQDDFFDPQYMSALYDVGYDRAFRGIAFQDGLRPEAVPSEPGPAPEARGREPAELGG